MKTMPLNLRIEVNEKFTVFMNTIVWLPLLNSGQSNLSNVQDQKVKELYDTAYDILAITYKYNDTDLYNRTLKAAEQIMPHKSAKSVMKDQEMYKKMLAARADFQSRVKKHLQY